MDKNKKKNIVDPSAKKPKLDPVEHKKEKEESDSLSENSSRQATEIKKSKEAANVRKKAHAKSIYNLRSEKNLNGKRFRDSPALDSNDGSDSDGESDHTKEIIDQISVELESEDIETRVEALKSLVHLLVDPSPALKKFVLEGACIDFLLKSLLSQELEEKFQSAWCITNIAAGSPDLCKKALSVLPTLNTLLSSKEMQLKKQAAWALGNMAADGSEFRLAIKANGSVPFLLKLLDEEDVELIKTACFALSNLSRYPNSISKQLIDLDIIKKLACLLENDQMNRAYPEIYWIIAYLTAETEEAGEKIIHSGMMGNIVKHMLGLSTIGNQCIPIVRIVGNLTSQGDCYSDIFLNNGTFLPVLFRYLVSDIRSVQKEALWALSNITAGQVSNVEITLDAGLLPIILPVALEGSFDIKKEAGYVIMNILSKGPNFIPVDDIKSLIPEFLSFLNSRDYEIAELGLQFFVAVLRHFPALTNHLENAKFVNDLENILVVFPDARMHVMIKSLLDQYSDLLENPAPPTKDDKEESEN